MTLAWKHLAHGALRQPWWLLRSASGDDAYERYLAHARLRHAREPALTRREFYDAQLRRKWSGVSRCC